MIFDMLKQLIKSGQIILILSLGYLGFLFAGRPDVSAWLFFTLALLSGQIVHISFYKIQKNKINNSGSSKSKVKKENILLWLFGIIASAIFIFSSFLINELCYYISIAVVIILFVYPVLRRLGSLPVVNIGIFEALCPIGGFIAANNRAELLPFILGISVLFWSSGFKILHTIYDKENDKVSNFIINLSIKKSRALSVVLFLLFLSLLILAGILTNRGLAYWISILCCIIILVRQEFLLSGKDIDSAEHEFLQINNFFAPALLTGTVIDVFFK